MTRNTDDGGTELGASIEELTDDVHGGDANADGEASTELGAGVEELIDGPDTCPACGNVLRDDHLHDDGRDVMHGDDNKIRGRDSHKIAQERYVCPDADGGGEIVVETEDGIERMTSDYRLENGFDQ